MDEGTKNMQKKKLMFQLVINQVLGWIISASNGMWNNTDLHGFASDLINLFLVDNRNRRTHFTSHPTMIRDNKATKRMILAELRVPNHVHCTL